MQIIKVNFDDGCFESIIRLYNSNFLSQKLVSDAYDNVIISGNRKFVKQEIDQNTKHKREGEDHKLTNTGATWFSQARGETDEESVAKFGSAEWQNFIEKARSEFHENYSWLEYYNEDGEISSSSVEEDTARLVNFFNKIWGWGSVVDISLSEEKEYTQIYGASLRLAISAEGVGAPKPIIGHIYFSSDLKGRLTPIKYTLSEGIHKSMRKFESELDKNVLPSQDERKSTVNKLLGALTQLFSGKKTGAKRDGLENYVYIPHEQDQEVLENIAKRSHGREGLIPLSCSSAVLLNIFHVKQVKRSYIVKYKGKLALRAEIDMNGSFTLYCCSCEDCLPLIISNTLVVDGGKEISLDISYENLGITSEDTLKEVKASLSKHLKPVSCEFGASCETIKCESELFFSDSEGRYFCKDCNHREIVSHIDGEPYLTKSLVFDSYSHSLVLQGKDEKLTRCAVCGRHYLGLYGDICDFCSGDEADTIESMLLYKRYASALPLHIRLKYAFEKKSCLEDEEFIVFNLGKDKYVLNKYARTDKNGLLPSPKKAKL